MALRYVNPADRLRANLTKMQDLVDHEPAPQIEAITKSQETPAPAPEVLDEVPSISPGEKILAKYGLEIGDIDPDYLVLLESDISKGGHVAMTATEILQQVIADSTKAKFGPTRPPKAPAYSLPDHLRTRKHTFYSKEDPR